MQMLIRVVLMATCCALWPQPAEADTTCQLSRIGQVLALQADCETDETLTIPEGATLDGRNHRITAVDPPGGHFTGAVVRNAGGVAHVRDLIVDTRALAHVCDGGRQRLRGIYFEAASGSIVGNRVLDVQQAGSGCQEGHGIEVRNPPSAEAETRRVHIAGNRVERYQKTGILVVGDVEAGVYLNEVVGLGPTERITQNGIQLSQGARGSVKLNRVRDNLYASDGYAATGILLLEAGQGIEVTLNQVEDADVGIRLVGTSESSVSGNRVRGATYDAIAVDGLSGAAQANHLWANHVRGNPVGIDLFGAGAIGNRVRANHVIGSSVAGIQVALEADANLISRNHVRESGQHGIWVGTNDNRVLHNHIRDIEGEPLQVEGEGNRVAGNRIR